MTAKSPSAKDIVTRAAALLHEAVETDSEPLRYALALGAMMLGTMALGLEDAAARRRRKRRR